MSCENCNPTNKPLLPHYRAQKVMPLVYDDSLSYYEILNKIITYINRYVCDGEALQDAINFIESITVINVAGEIGYGTYANPIDLGSLDITDFSCLYFAKGKYYIKSLNIANIKNVTFVMPEAEINLVDDYLIKGKNCDFFAVIGGKIDGDDNALYGIQLEDSKSPVFSNVTFANFGNAEKENVSMLNLFGDCTGLHVEKCLFDTCTAGVLSSDGFIHSYGLFINRLNSSKTYSKNGVVSNCRFYNIASQDGDSKTGDGDGIFVQAPPYNSEDNVRVVPVSEIAIEHCVFDKCKKRGIKSATYGLKIYDCTFTGSFWYACIDMQYGHNLIENCWLINESDYNKSTTSVIIGSDGGFEVKGCYISAPYVFVNEETGESKNTYHPGIRFGARLGASVIPQSEYWDICRIYKCYFDKCSRGVFAYNSNENPPTYKIKGIEVTDCRWGDFNQSHGVDISPTFFEEIRSFVMTDFIFDYGKTRQEVAETNEDFTYPLGIGVPVTDAFDYYSKYWINEPMSGYNELPTAYHTNIIYEGDNMGGITYKKYTTHGSEITGNKNPNDYTATLAKQLLYNSKVGDKFTNTSDGSLWVCTTAGTQDTVGTWTRYSSNSVADDGNGNISIS